MDTRTLNRVKVSPRSPRIDVEAQFQPQMVIFRINSRVGCAKAVAKLLPSGGRSVPSREFLLIVSDALNIPLRERNALLLASGYAPFYTEQSMDAEQMVVVTWAIDRMIEQHEPIPRLCRTGTGI